MNMGMFITIEGGEGSGKSTAIKGIKKKLEQRGYTVIVTREPGGVEVSENIRGILVHQHMDELTETLLFAASRHEVILNVIEPALQKGYVVICDRFVDSSVVYQGYVRGVGMKKVYELNKMILRGCLPDLTLYFDIDPVIGLQRIEENNREINKFEQEDIQFHKKVREGYKLLTQNPHMKDRIRTINAQKSKEEVLKDAMDSIDEKINKMGLTIQKGTLL